MRRLILGNLLFEEELAHRSTPPRKVLETASGAATLLAAFAREGDRLWTPAPVDPERLAEIPGLPRTVLESGPLRNLAPAAEVLAWGESPEAAALRAQKREPAISLDAPLHDLLWRLPVASSEVVAAVHHRFFCLRVAEELGCTLPGARIVESLADLDLDLASRDAPRSWVVKAPLSASGRSRFIEREGPTISSEKGRRTVERLFDRHGPLLFEPWMDRVEDFGCSVLLTPDEMRKVSFHRQLVDRKGQFAGIELEAELPPAERERVEEVVHGVASALRREGYVGPFGIDLWRYRRPDGEIVLHPLGEINARMTFGLVTRALAERAGRPMPSLVPVRSKS
ncbi:MAG TPA: hypothetical protein VLT87_14585 [Thermoanaerobaculia bacterium]|nr:hypothetical protein [Thermoanaerobaculia bacterium]